MCDEMRRIFLVFFFYIVFNWISSLETENVSNYRKSDRPKISSSVDIVFFFANDSCTTLTLICVDNFKRYFRWSSQQTFNDNFGQYMSLVENGDYELFIDRSQNS
ncbi:Uncharacterised protein at_DN1864 [Pycnogonum litorale]